MTIPALGEATIRQHSSEDSFRRGQAYERQGAVIALVQRGAELEAEVEGSQYEPYQVRVTFDPGGVTGAMCSCPYDWGGWCKHIVAVLLACLRSPEAVEERPPLEALLAGLDREQLQTVLLNLSARDPSLADAIESQVILLESSAAAQQAAQTGGRPSRQTPVDPQPFRRQVHAALHSLDRMRRSEAYWHVGGVVDDLRQVLAQVRAFLDAGDGHNALAILEAITDEYVEEWEILDDSDGEASGFFADVGPVWAEALLTAELTPTERRQWARKLERWQAEIGQYGVDEAFLDAIAAAEQGWDDPLVQRALRGEAAEPEEWEDEESWDDEAAWYGDQLVIARLNVLERQGRFQEYLNLARAEGQIEPYLIMLVRLGRGGEAVAEGLRLLTAPDQALTLAQTLREREDLEGARRIAEHGLTLEGRKGALAAWLSELASGIGAGELALQAAVIAFRESPSLSAYLRVQELAGGRWPELRANLLDHLRDTSGYSVQQAQVDVFLHEGLIDDAIASVREWGGYGLLERVMDAAIQHRPDWVIEAARRQAESIMDRGKADAYQHAVEWLKRARAAYRAAGREADWQAYLQDLRIKHSRKYKLMGMLKVFA